MIYNSEMIEKLYGEETRKTVELIIAIADYEESGKEKNKKESEN